MASPTSISGIERIGISQTVCTFLVRAGVAPMPGCCFARYTGFRWGSRSPIKRLYLHTRCGPQPLQRISTSSMPAWRHSPADLVTVVLVAGQLMAKLHCPVAVREHGTSCLANYKEHTRVLRHSAKYT